MTPINCRSSIRNLRVLGEIIACGAAIAESGIFRNVGGRKMIVASAITFL